MPPGTERTITVLRCRPQGIEAHYEKEAAACIGKEGAELERATRLLVGGGGRTIISCLAKEQFPYAAYFVAGNAMDCCLCSSTGISYRPPRNTICISCFDGARLLLELARQLEQDWRDDIDDDKVPRALVPRQGLCYAYKQMKHLEANEEEASEKLEFLESLVHAFRDEMHADVELITNDGISLKAHRVIMATKSSVFRGMFEADRMKGPHTGPIHIQELSHDQLKYLLEFLYCAHIPDEKLSQHSHALLIAADKYDIPVLSKVCEAYISSTISPSNVLEILELVTLCSATSLKDTAFGVILKSYEEVIFSKGYEDFAMKNPLMAVEITKALIRDCKK